VVFPSPSVLVSGREKRAVVSYVVAVSV
jgi:hypothetical protein